MQFSSCLATTPFRWLSCAVPPVPIPNTEVKRTYTDNTWLETAREDRQLPESMRHSFECLFSFTLAKQRADNARPCSHPGANADSRFCCIRSACSQVGIFLRRTVLLLEGDVQGFRFLSREAKTCLHIPCNSESHDLIFR